MNNMGFFNPFGSSGSGGGGGGGSTANYSVKTFTDSSGQVSYKLTKNGIAVGDVISFNGSNMLVSYGGELVVLNSAIAGIEEALDKTYNFTTFTELGINTQNKTLSQLSAELVAKNLEEGTVVTGRVYSEALPYNNYGNAEVLVNNSILWWKTSSSTISPYSWNAIVVGNTVKMDWTPTYYQLPIASAQSLGGVKIGDNVQIAPDGTISVITTKGDTGTGIASIAKTSSSGLNDIYTITYTDSTTSTFTVTNGATITGGSIGQTGHLILTMSDGRTIDAGALPTDNEVEVTTTSSQPADPNVELWVDLSTQQTLDIPEINDSSTSSTQDTWSCKKIYDEQQRQDNEISYAVNTGVKNLSRWNSGTSTSAEPTMAKQIPFTSDGGEYTISYNTALTTGTIAIGFKDSGGTTTLTVEIGNANKVKTITIPANTAYFNIYTLAYGDYSNFMICKKAVYDADPTYQPYAMSNPVLTPAAIKAVDEGAKNICNMFASVFSNRTQDGVTVTRNDETINVLGTSGTGTNNSFNIYVFGAGQYDADRTIPPGDWVAMFYGSGTGVEKLSLAAVNGNSITRGEVNAPVEFTIPSDSEHNWLRLQVAASTSYNCNIKIMICTKEEWDVSHAYEPYALSNPVITPALIEQVDNGVKNLLYYTEVGTSVDSGSQYLSNGVRFTMQSDGSVLVNRESSNANEAFCNLRLDSSSQFIDDFCNGQYVLSGSYGDCILRATNNTYNVIDSNRNGVVLQDKGAQKSIWVQLRVAASASPNNVLVKPMICTKAAWDISHKFEPYALPNSVLTPALIEQVDGGAKNVLNSIATTGSSGSLSWTVASDGTITVNGNNDTGGRVDIHLFGVTYLPNIYSGMLLSGCKNEQSSAQYYILALYSDNGSTWSSEKAQYNAPIIIGNSPYCRISIMVANGATLNNVVFKPMICTIADWNASQEYVPYRPSWQEVADELETKVTMNNVYGFGTAIPSNSNLNDYKTPGVYRVESSTVAGTISNLPTGAAAGRLEVKGLNAADRYLQIYYSGDVIFQRRWNGSSWFTWYKFEGTAVT